MKKFKSKGKICGVCKEKLEPWEEMIENNGTHYHSFCFANKNEEIKNFFSEIVGEKNEEI